MKLITIIFAYGALATQGRYYNKCKLSGKTLKNGKQYLDLVTVQYPQSISSERKCELGKEELKGCDTVSVLPSYVPKNKQKRFNPRDRDLQNLKAAGKAGVNFDLSHFKGSIETFVESITPSYANSSTLTLDSTGVNSIDFFSKVFKQFKAVFIQNPLKYEFEYYYDKFDDDAHRVAYKIEVDEFIHSSKVYSILTKEESNRRKGKLPNINVVIAESKEIPFQCDPSNNEVGLKATWFISQRQN